MTGIEEVALIASLAGAAVSAYGAYQQGQFQKASSNYQAQVATQDAGVAQEQAAAQADQDKRMAYLRIGAAKASYGASGVSSAGSPIDVIGDIAAQSELQRQNDLYQGNLKARGSGETATTETAAGKAAASGGTLTAGASLLAGGANAYSGYKRLNPSSASAPSGGAGSSLSLSRG